MNDFDETLRRLAATEPPRTPEGFAARQRARIAALPARRRRRPARFAAAACLAAVLAVSTALAAALGAFDFLKTRGEYAHLELAALYERYATPVGQTDSDGPFTLTVDKLALDGSTCTVFYQIESAEPLPQNVFHASYPSAALTQNKLSLSFSLCGADGAAYAEGDTTAASADWGANQTYYAGDRTLYGVNRLLMDRAAAPDEPLTLRVSLQYAPAPDDVRSHAFSLPLNAHPLATHTAQIGVSSTADDGAGACTFTLDRLTTSPLGSFLTVIEEIPDKRDDTPYSFTADYGFALRDGAGRDIPYSVARIDTLDKTRVAYRCELLGDWQTLRSVTLIPISRLWDGENIRRHRFALDALPAAVEAETGGFVIEAMRRTDDYFEFTCRPQGLQGALHPPELRLYGDTGAEEGDFLFSGFVSRRDGTMTVRFDRSETTTDAQMSRITQVHAVASPERPLLTQAFTAEIG